jgi:SAM-dependent methyltransferase
MTMDKYTELIESYSKKSLEARWGKSRVVIDVPFDVFSSFQLDVGTMFLLRNISKQGRQWTRGLDVGCGYGTIGLYLRALGLASYVEGIDRDFLAVTFAQHNAQRNDISNIAFEAGLAYQDVSGPPYDLVASNIPAKAGDSVHRLMLLGASRYLHEAGQVWIVVVRPLEANVERILSDPSVEVLAKIERKGHIAYSYRFLAPVEPPPDPYNRGVHRFAYRDQRWSVETVWGLPEFDTLSFDTELILELIPAAGEGRDIRELLVHNPGQGHIPLASIRMLSRIETITLRARDLLALRASERNLRREKFTGQIHTQLTVDVPLDRACLSAGLLIARLEHDLGPELNCRMVARWAGQMGGRPIIIGCRAPLARQIRKRLKEERIQVGAERSRKGFCAFRIN